MRKERPSADGLANVSNATASARSNSVPVRQARARNGRRDFGLRVMPPRARRSRRKNVTLIVSCNRKHAQ